MSLRICIFSVQILIIMSLLETINGQCPAPGDCNLICGSRDHIFHCNPPSCNCRCGVRPNPIFCRPAPLDCAAFCSGLYPRSAICAGRSFPQCSCFC